MFKKILNKLNHSLQGKLTIWYLSSMSIVIAIFVVATSGLFWFTLQNQIDHHVHIVVTEASQIVQQFQGEQRQELLTNLVSAKGMTIVLLSPDGSPILETNSPDVALVTEHELQGILSSSSLYDSVPSHFTESGIRFAAMPVQVNAGKGILAVGYSTQVLYSTFTNMLLIVGGIILFCVIPVTFYGIKLLKRQLQPLQSIARQASSINTSTSLHQRIQLDKTTEELSTIQNTLNKMLSQLENVFLSERVFFSDAAHTLKTPLAVLRSQIENMRVSDKNKTELLEVIDSTNETIQDLLFLSKIGGKQQETEKVSISQLLENIADITRTLGENKNIRVDSNIEKEIYVTTNRQMLQRALSNIIHNAVIYNKDNGSIAISLKKKNDTAIIVISDSGKGVSSAEKKKIFDRFYRGKNREKSGSGLGLSISKAVFDTMGGSIVFDSRLHKGSTVTIVLPIA